MNREEYIDLFHRAEVNLVAFKQVNDCDEELRKMVEMAVKAEREACALLCYEQRKHWDALACADAIRAGTKPRGQA
jgi:hypothetical protein